MAIVQKIVEPSYAPINSNPTCGQFGILPDELSREVFLHAIISAPMPSKCLDTISRVCWPFHQILSGPEMVVSIWRKLFPSNLNLDPTNMNASIVKQKIFAGLNQERMHLQHPLSFPASVPAISGKETSSLYYTMYYMYMENRIEFNDIVHMCKAKNIPSKWSSEAKELVANGHLSLSIPTFLQKFHSEWQSELESPTSLLHRLEDLSLNYSNLLRLPAEICSLTNLDSLDLRFNAFTSIPTNLNRLTNLTIVNLTGNSIENPSSQLALLTSLKPLVIVPKYKIMVLGK